VRPLYPELADWPVKGTFSLRMNDHDPLDVNSQPRTKPRYSLMGSSCNSTAKLGHQMQLCKLEPTYFPNEGGAVHLRGDACTS